MASLADSRAPGFPAHLLYYWSRFTSQTGQGIFFAFLFLEASSASGALQFSGVMIAMVAGAVALGPSGGTLVDRLGPRAALATGALLRLIAIASAFLVLGHDEHLWAIALAYSAASQVFSPAELALASAFPQPPTRTHASLAVLQIGGQAVGGLLVAPLLWAIAGAPAVILGAATLYVLLLPATAALSVQLRRCTLSGRERPRRDLRFLRALRILSDEPAAWYAVGLLAITDIATRSLLIAGPLYLSHELGLSSAQMGLLVITGATGALLGLAWAASGVRLARPLRSMRLIWLALVTSVFALAPLGDGVANATSYGAAALGAGRLDSHFMMAFVAALPAALVLGFSLSVAPVVARSVLTIVTPAESQGRMFAAQSTFSHLLVIPILVVAGLATEIVAARATVILVGVLGATTFLLFDLAQARARRAITAPLEPAALPVPTSDAP
jgi:MFS-type transporter involved in bile tolerance (Atg22 family)